MGNFQFYVVQEVGAEVIFGYDFRTTHVEAICTRRLFFELDDGITVTVIRDVFTRNKTKVTLPEAQIYSKRERRSTFRIFGRKTIRFELESQT